MISRKILNKATWILAVLLVLVFIGLTIYQRHLLKQTVLHEGAPVSEGAGGDEPDMAELERQAALKQQRVELQRQLAQDPAVREAIRSSIEIQYADLFGALGLSPEKREKLGTLLESSAVEYLVLNPDILTAASDEEKATVQKRYDYLRKETQLKAEALLGSEDYELYRAYEARAVSRGIVDGFEKTLTPEVALNDSQALELVEIIHGESHAVYGEIGYDPTERIMFPSEMDAAAIANRVEITDRILDRSAESAAEILSAPQSALFREYLRDYSEAQEMSLFKMYQPIGE